MQKFCAMNKEAKQCVAIIFFVQISLFNIVKGVSYTDLTRFCILQLESAVKFSVRHHQEQLFWFKSEHYPLLKTDTKDILM